MILPSLLILALSCQDLEPETVDLYELGYNTSENRSAILLFSQDREAMLQVRNDYLNNYLNTQFIQGYSTPDGGIDMEKLKDELLKKYQECTSCGGDYKELMIPFLEGLFSASNDNLMTVIDEFEGNVLSSNLDNESKSNLLFVAYGLRIGSQIGIDEVENNADDSGCWDCFRSKAGSDVGAGIALGFLGGCAVGGIEGALGGSVVLPGGGTAVGAVAGCIIGGAKGAIAGGALGAVVAGARCLFN